MNESHVETSASHAGFSRANYGATMTCNHEVSATLCEACVYETEIARLKEINTMVLEALRFISVSNDSRAALQYRAASLLLALAPAKKDGE